MKICWVCLQIAFTFVVYPSLILAYMGQAAYLSTHHKMETDYHIGFYVSVPGMSNYNFLHDAILSEFELIWDLLFLSRENKVACSGDSNTCSCGWKSGDHHRDVLDNQAVLLSWMLPQGQNCSYILENSWADLHPWDQLDLDAALLSGYSWVQGYETHGQCCRY